MASNKRNRDYKREYETYHKKPEQIRNRSLRNQARRKLGLKNGDSREVDHKQPLSKGGSNDKSNLQAISRTKNRQKYNNEDIVREFIYTPKIMKKSELKELVREEVQAVIAERNAAKWGLDGGTDGDRVARGLDRAFDAFSKECDNAAKKLGVAIHLLGLDEIAPSGKVYNIIQEKIQDIMDSAAEEVGF